MTTENPNPTPSPEPTPGTGPVNYASPTTPSQGLFAAPPVPATPVPVEHRQFGMLVHLLSLAGLLIPTANIIAPLVFWMMKKQESTFLDDQGKESINFQITATIAMIVLMPTMCIGIGFGLVPAVGIAALVFSIIAALKANEGTYYRYPFSMRLIK